ncbi:DENTIN SIALOPHOSPHOPROTEIN-LIKE PROTEIN [Salix viminalis]|uniref:DENTIN SIALOPHOSPHOPROTEIN-LIKE PROTEIN n=1 Tax=Salix viminalis TaxID=40686 RepID=A0A9Q0NVT9_SALVM|nr:DENTIN SIALOPHOSPHOPROTEIN-LIKE PROTEIN [Salix viminalis]
MPGNEAGDRIHNFFGQDNWSQGQHQAQAVDGTWNGLNNNNPWAGSHWQIGTSLISNLKNGNVHRPADTERGGESSSVQHDMYLSHSNPGPEFARSQPESQQPPLNGYMHGHQVLQSRQDEANFVGVDIESDRRNISSKGFSMLDSQLGNGPDFLKKNPARMDFNESPVNYDFFRGQQQISGQHSGMLQPFPRQQSGISDVQLLQQQFLLKQMQEMQRQQQLQKQQDARKLNSMNQVSAFAKQAAGYSQALINGIPIHETSNFSWQPELMAASSHWPQQGVPPVMQGSFRGHMLSPEQGQATTCLIGTVPHHADQSLYGVPISGTRVSSGQYSPVQMDKPSMQQISGSSSSIPSNQYTGFPEQVNMQDGTLVSRQGYQGKNTITSSDGHGIDSGFNLEKLQQKVNPQQSNGLVQEICSRQDLAGPSETSQEETAVQVAPSQNKATLDPTEAMILFGSDDNSWDTFGRGVNMGPRGHNMLDSTDFFSTLPSVQSGSWSALMQSAVAETSGGDTGLKEEWSGLTCQNNDPPAGNQQTPTVNDSSKQQSNWDDNSLQSASSLNSRPFPVSHKTNTGMSCNNIPGVHQSGVNTSHEHSERLQTGSPHRHIQHFQGDGTKRSDRSFLQKPTAEGSHFYGKATRSSDAELNARSIQGPWANQQSMPSYNSSGQPLRSPSGRNFMDSASSITTPALKSQGNEKPCQDSQNADKKSPLFEVTSHGTDKWKATVSNSIAELECAKSSMRSPLVNQEDTNHNNVAVLLDSSTERADTESSQQLPKNNSIDIWKHAGLSVNYNRTEIPGKYQPRMVKNDQPYESPENSSLANGAVETHRMQNSNTDENTTASVPDTTHQASTFGARENAWLGANDSFSLSRGKQKSPSNKGRKPSGIRKFQYHPMGDLDIDMEPSYGTKHVANSKFTPQQFSQRLNCLDQGYIEQPNIPSHVARDSVEIEKGHLSGFQGETKGLDEIPSDSAPGLSTPVDRSVFSPNTTISSHRSQNMLELLHKVDQSREQGNEKMHFSSLDCTQSTEMPEAETLDASFHVQKNQSSASQAFGLQLAPPSQQLLIPEHVRPSQNPSNAMNSTWLVPTPSIQSLTPHETSYGHLRNAICSTSMYAGSGAQRKFSAVFPPGFPYSRSHSSTQHRTDTGGQATTSESVNESFDRFCSQPKQTRESSERGQTNRSAIPLVLETSRHTSHNDNASSSEMTQPSSNNQDHARDSAQQFLVLEAAPAPAPHLNALSQDTDSSKTSPTMWTTVPTQLRPFGSQPFQALSSMFKPNLQSHNSSGTTFSQPQKPEDQIMQAGGSSQAESGVCSRNSHGFVEKEQLPKGDHSRQASPENDQAQKTVNASHDKDSIVNHLTETSLSNLASTQKQIEAFGRSLKPNNTLHQNYSLLHQMQGMENAGQDHGNGRLNRFKSPDGSVDPQLVATQGDQQFYGLNDMVRDASTNHTSIPPGDSKMLRFSGKTADTCDTNAPSKEMLAFSRNDSQSSANSNGEVSVRGEHSQVSPQLAPSWFDQYGTFKNGQILRMHDAQRIVTVKTSELPFTTGRPDDPLHAHSSIEQGNAAAAASQFGIVQKSTTHASIACENFLSSQPLQPDSAYLSPVVMRPKKRKNAISELLTWHEEVMHCPQRLQNISVAEVDWAQTTNRLTEKVEDEVEMVDDGLSVLRSKRRLILTTQLMQILLNPPMASILSADAVLHYENAAYFVARSTLGDACSSLSYTGRDTPAPSNSGDHLPEKIKSSKKISDQYFSKVMEDLISRTTKLESDFLRLDKRASVSDLRVECQDLERFSVINRFAKFHGRGQGDVAESSSSSDASVNAQKSCLQRYATAQPMPRNLPDRVPCLSL